MGFSAGIDTWETENRRVREKNRKAIPLPSACGLVTTSTALISPPHLRRYNLIFNTLES